MGKKLSNMKEFAGESKTIALQQLQQASRTNKYKFKKKIISLTLRSEECFSTRPGILISEQDSGYQIY